MNWGWLVSKHDQTHSWQGDPFGSVDPFASFGGTDNTKLDAFDPFGKSGPSGSSKLSVGLIFTIFFL